MKIELASQFDNNTLVILKSLEAGDLDTAAALRDSVALVSNAPHIELIELASKHHRMDVLKALGERTREGLKPIIHFETHGNKDDGVYIARSREFVSWIDLAGHFRIINVGSGGNLGVVFSACFGFYAIKAVEIFSPAPAYVMIGPKNKVSAGYILDNIRKFYEILYKSSDLVKALAAISDEFSQFHAEKFFTETIVAYFREACAGKGGLARKERLISEVMSQRINPTKQDLKHVRRTVKEFIKPNFYAFQRISRSFIVDKGRYPVSFPEIMKLVHAPRQ